MGPGALYLRRQEVDTTRTQFAIPRARFNASGTTLTPNLRFGMQLAMDNGNVALNDYFLDYGFTPQVRLRVGQWKQPFSRQRINAASRLEFLDPAATQGAFAANRDIGMAIHNDYEQSPRFEYVLGLFNGTGSKTRFSGDVEVDLTTGQGKINQSGTSNVPDKFYPALVGRIGYNSPGLKGYSEADLEGGPVCFGVAVGSLINFDIDDDDVSGILAQADYIFKAYGFSTTGGVYFSSGQDGQDFRDQVFAAVGLHAQASYLIAQRMLPALRYAVIAPDGSNNDFHEITAAFSVFFFAHRLKWQNEVMSKLREQSGADTVDYTLRSQVQLVF
ncbi:MAG: porin [Myxococcota bacterium]